MVLARFELPSRAGGKGCKLPIFPGCQLHVSAITGANGDVPLRPVRSDLPHREERLSGDGHGSRRRGQVPIGVSARVRHLSAVFPYRESIYEYILEPLVPPVNARLFWS